MDGRADGRSVKRRDAIRALAAAALTTAFKWTPAEAQRAADLARQAIARGSYEPKFFSAHEWETVRVLVDMILPRDERSGSATDAGVPEFMDFMLTERTDGQIPMRGGLSWLDTETRERFGKSFIAATEAERAAVLDLIAWPKRAQPAHSQGVAFFNSFRDLTATGFFTSKMGIADLEYRGNEFVSEWTGCSEVALRKLDVRYDD
jgi:gluconate 2-dehydrogenase gamma chain